jgi:competence protein ComGC
MNQTAAFTRLELVAVVAILSLLGAMTLPLLAATRADSDRAGCFNNLRLLGRAITLWGDDRDGLPPWITFVSRGGTRPDGAVKAGSAWFEFSTLSNELVTPRLLACPADTGVKLASEFSNLGGRGYMATGMRALATSYTINMDNLGNVPERAVTGDRNLRSDGLTQCGQGVNNADLINLAQGQNPVLWTNAVHGLQGHFVRTDGSVVFSGSALLLANPQRLLDDNGFVHLLRAR